MKTKLLFLITALALCLAPLTFTGCGSTPERTREAVVFDTCRSTYNGAREAYKAVVKLHLTGQISDAKRRRGLALVAVPKLVPDHV